MENNQMKNDSNIMKKLFTIFTYAFLIFMGIIVIIPFYWMINTGLKGEIEVMLFPPTLFPHDPHFENFYLTLSEETGGFNFFPYLWNTVVVAVISTIGTLITTILAAYAFAKLEFKGKNAIFSLMLATMMIPGEMLVITNYLTVAKIGWLSSDTGVIAAMTVPFFISVFYIFLLRQTFKQIPNELYLAAKVDGKSDMTYLRKVMIPLAAPTLITIIILKVMGTWNSYVWPNLVTATRPGMKLITNGLRAAFADTDKVTTHLQMAATFVVTVPLLILFICFRKYIMRGVSRSGIKG